jgi:hypothetical protein
MPSETKYLNGCRIIRQFKPSIPGMNWKIEHYTDGKLVRTYNCAILNLGVGKIELYSDKESFWANEFIPFQYVSTNQVLYITPSEKVDATQIEEGKAELAKCL